MSDEQAEADTHWNFGGDSRVRLACELVERCRVDARIIDDDHAGVLAGRGQHAVDACQRLAQPAVYRDDDIDGSRARYRGRTQIFEWQISLAPAQKSRRLGVSPYRARQ